MTECYVPGYPRPQFVRESWTDLCGGWNFRFDEDNAGLAQGWHLGFTDREIAVPFSCETELSGIHETAHHPRVWYSRNFSATAGRHILLHFEGADYLTTVWVNGQRVGSHEGGYTRFSFDISAYLARDGGNVLTVRCEDAPDRGYPRGKQRWLPENYACWYVQTTGIWKPVWLEEVPGIRLESVKITPDFDRDSVAMEYTLGAAAAGVAVEAEVSFQGTVVARQTTAVEGICATAVIGLYCDALPWGVRHWSPKSPDLYDVKFSVIADGRRVDTVKSYFGLRKISIQGNTVLLNNAPLYQKLILDQGYWPDGGLTAPSEQALIEDIDKIRALGFNGVRKHQKTEDERFAYWCDVKGMLLWCEMPSFYAYGDAAAQRFTAQWLSVVRQFRNHPCVIAWTPINESWGVPRVKTRTDQQAFITGIYHLTKALDPTRPVITNDGWEHTCSDIVTLHEYEQTAPGSAQPRSSSGRHPYLTHTA